MGKASGVPVEEEEEKLGECGGPSDSAFEVARPGPPPRGPRHPAVLGFKLPGGNIRGGPPTNPSLPGPDGGWRAGGGNRARLNE